MVFQKNTIIPGFLITTWSKDQGQLPLKYKHVTSGEHSSYLHISCSTYLSCVQSIFVAQTRVPPLFLGHSPLGQELSWKTEIWQLRVYFKPETFQTGKRGERGAKTNLTGKETEIALISLLSPCWAVESAIPVFVQRALGFTQKAFQGCWMLGPVRQNWCIL